MSNMRELLSLSIAEGNTVPLGADTRKQAKSGTLLSVAALRNAATRLAELRAKGNSLNTRELVGLLVCNAQRSRRITLPAVSVRISTASFKGKIAVKMSLR